MPSADLVVWPEAAIPAYLRARDLGFVAQQRLVATVAQWQRPLLTGAWDWQGARHHNALFVLGNSGLVSDSPYIKSRLLPFGEYVPPWASRVWRARTDRFGPDAAPGPGPRPLIVPLRADTITVGPQICYEGLFPALSRSLGDQGAHLLVNVANDSCSASRSPCINT